VASVVTVLAGATLDLTGINTDLKGKLTLNSNSSLTTDSRNDTTWFRFSGGSNPLENLSAQFQVATLQFQLTDASQTIQLLQDIGASSSADTNQRIDLVDITTGKLDLNGNRAVTSRVVA